MSTFMPHGSNPQTSSFTCNTCGIRFPTAELQRFHMKSEWHRYNLKRRVAQLGPITSEIFAQKVIQKQEEDHDEEDEFGFTINKRKSKNGVKQVTKKERKRLDKFASLRGRQLVNDQNIARDFSPASTVATELSQFSLGESVVSNMLNSTDVESVIDTASDIVVTEPDYSESSGSDYSSNEEEEYEFSSENAISCNTCLFCGVGNREIENNVRHMFHKHGLYIPERSYLTNLSGLLEFLGVIVGIDKQCLVCNFQGKNLESIRQHMASKGHCRIPYESKEERAFISEFYDFSSLSQNIPNKLSKKKVAFEEPSDTSNINDEDIENFDDSDFMSSDDEEDCLAIVQVDRSGVELTLPTGSRIGHRSMQRYYRQHVRLDRQQNDGERTVALVDKRFANSLTSAETRELKQVRRVEEKEKQNHNKKSQFRRSNFQAHFRDTILGT